MKKIVLTVCLLFSLPVRADTICDHMIKWTTICFDIAKERKSYTCESIASSANLIAKGISKDDRYLNMVEQTCLAGCSMERWGVTKPEFEKATKDAKQECDVEQKENKK